MSSTIDNYIAQGEKLGYKGEGLQLFVQKCLDRDERALVRQAETDKIAAEAELLLHEEKKTSNDT